MVLWTQLSLYGHVDVRTPDLNTLRPEYRAAESSDMILGGCCRFLWQYRDPKVKVKLKYMKKINDELHLKRKKILFFFFLENQH